jgi:hypothetical protein
MTIDPALAFNRRFREPEDLEIGPEGRDPFGCQCIRIAFAAQVLELVNRVQDEHAHGPEGQRESAPASDERRRSTQERLSPDVVGLSGLVRPAVTFLASVGDARSIGSPSSFRKSATASLLGIVHSTLHGSRSMM